MKKVLLISAAFIFLFISQSLMIMKKDGAAPGYTGSPGDSLKNCTNCHGGTAISVDNWITSNIPAEGYVPGATYTITAVNKEWGATRFGFEVSPQNINGKLLGTMIITDSIRTKLVGGTKYITYTENGVEGSDSLSWSFNWTAPQQGDDELTFYAAFNSNFEGHKDGDKTYLSTLKVKRNGSTGLIETPEIHSFIVYPNPTYDFLQLKIEVQVKCNMLAEIIDINGKRVSLLMDGIIQSGTFNKRFDISNLAEGHYVVSLSVNGNTTYQRVKILR